MSQTQKTSNPRKNTTSNPSSVSKKEFEDMKKQIEQLTKALHEKESTAIPISVKSSQSIDLDEDIDVISLCNNKLNLSTGGFGKGAIYYFDYFGEIKPIPYRDLKEILTNQDGMEFLKKGYYYIDNDKARKSLRVNKIHDGLPEAQDLITLFDKDLPMIKVTLERMTPQQRTMIASIIIDKLFNNEKIDMNIVKEIGDSVGKDLVTIANDRKEVISGGE